MRAIWFTGSPFSFTRDDAVVHAPAGAVVVAIAEHGAALRAVAAMTAVGTEREDDVVALLDVGDAGAELATMPAASCPSTIGSGSGQSPFMMC